LAAITGFAAMLMIGGLVLAAEPASDEDAKIEENTYPLDICIVSGGKLGSMGEPVLYEYEGREIRFCCKGCIGLFEKDPETYLKKMDKAIIAAELEVYALRTCVVSGDTLGTMGEPVDLVHDSQLVRLCCAGCIPAFEKDPEKYMKMLRPVEADTLEVQEPNGPEGHGK
jgi:YHS domain-containing protein